ncbi:DUF4442 domain-containing protein [Haloarchaeobius sp. HME9146]|uniref:DUF4442 domain-containing protein n=1 Tax=Haloarchaeobius sp. HME9146 TaxID=2978732 RepID=UPI0021C04856|nr:DUF4442 domain-containing protein [Haloarchaeobius sp. HME9146]MCT9095623.1 DUF4442 domain-containing protein [Haloarchaeobius sp. HME9146]
MSESWRTRLFRLGFNVWPSYRGTGGRVQYIADDWQEIRIKIPQSWRTRNYMGTIFGGSIYGACDPMFAMMLIKALPGKYVVWDRSTEVQFKKPGTEDLYARFRMPDEELDAIQSALEDQDSIDREYTADVVAEDGTVHATVEKTVHVSTDESKLA